MLPTVSVRVTRGFLNCSSYKGQTLPCSPVLESLEVWRFPWKRLRFTGNLPPRKQSAGSEPGAPGLFNAMGYFRKGKKHDIYQMPRRKTAVPWWRRVKGVEVRPITPL